MPLQSEYCLELSDGCLKNTGHCQCECPVAQHIAMSYLHMHCPVLQSFLYRTKSQNTGQSG